MYSHYTVDFFTYLIVTVQLTDTLLPSCTELVITAVPFALAVTTPEEETTATFLLFEVHFSFLFVAETGKKEAFNASFFLRSSDASRVLNTMYDIFWSIVIVFIVFTFLVEILPL